MENKKTISYLNDKAWYRLLKVIFILLILLCLYFLFVLLAENGIKRLDNNKTLIYCKRNTEEFSPRELGIELTKSNFTSFGEFIDTNNKIWNTCNGGGFTNFYTSERYVTLPNDVFDIKPIYTYTEFTKHFIFYSILVLLFFEILKRTFYYIILGKINPNK